MASTAPTCSGVFFRLHCRHQQLFDTEYKRSNRNRGTKILRCFPHCCPSHVERSYCGSSLELAVEMHQRVPFDAQSLFVFARFETVDLETTLAVGQRCSLQHMQSLSQSETNPEALWTQGVLQPRSSSSHISSSSSGSASAMPSSGTGVFLLNGQTSSKWYYHWESGANKARRLTKHVLKAYIMYRRPQKRGSGTSGLRGGAEREEDLIEVVCAVTSPPFTLVSYRRAWETLDGAMLEGGATAIGRSYPADAHTPPGTQYDLHQIVRGQISQAFREFQKPLAAKRQGKRRGDALKDEGRDDMEDIDDKEEETGSRQSAVVLDQLIWERYHATRTLQPLKDLAVVYYFVSHIPMAFATQSPRVREHVYAALQHHWIRKRQPAALLSRLFPRASDGCSPATTTTTTTTTTATAQVDKLLLIVAKLSIWLLSSENVQIFQSFFDSHTIHDLLHKRRLRDAFLQFTGLVCERIQIFWSTEIAAAPATAVAAATVKSELPTTPTAAATTAAETTSALCTLSEHILAFSHVHVDFQHLWPGLREILEKPSPFLWEGFIAQLRETCVRQQPVRIPVVPDAEFMSELSGHWILDAASTSMDLVVASPLVQGPSISAALLAMVQLQQLRIRVLDDNTLQFRGDNSLLPERHAWMVLVCDGTPRTTSVLPLGISTLVGTQVFGGDYVGSLNHAHGQIQIAFHWWPYRFHHPTAGNATRVVVTMELDPQAACLLASIEIQHGTIPRGDVHYERRLTRLELCTPRERLALPVSWVAVWRASSQFVLAET